MALRLRPTAIKGEGTNVKVLSPLWRAVSGQLSVMPLSLALSHIGARVLSEGILEAGFPLVHYDCGRKYFGFKSLKKDKGGFALTQS